jgi:hypothetical protein
MTSSRTISIRSGAFTTALRPSFARRHPCPRKSRSGLARKLANAGSGKLRPRRDSRGFVARPRRPSTWFSKRARDPHIPGRLFRAAPMQQQLSQGPPRPKRFFATKDTDAGEWRSLSPSRVEDLTCGDDLPIALFLSKTGQYETWRPRWTLLRTANRRILKLVRELKFSVGLTLARTMRSIQLRTAREVWS